MRKITCDWCEKDINVTNYDFTHIEFYTGKMIDLCEECDKHYFKVREELAEYSKQLNERHDELLKEKYKELLKREVTNNEEE